MTLYLVVVDDVNGENKDLFVMADSPADATTKMFVYYDHTWADFDEDVRVFPVPMPLKNGAIEWPDPFVVPHP